MSDSDLLIPINELTQADNQDAQTFGQVFPRRLPAGDNYAEDPATMALIQEELVPVVQQTRNNRTGLSEEWHAIQRMEMLIHDDGRKYRGRSDAYLPVYARLLKTQTATLAKGLFPSDEYMDCVDRNDLSNPEAGKAAKTYVQWEFERNAKLRRVMKVFLRQLKNYGNSPLKYLYKKEKKYEGRNLNVQDLAGGVHQQGAFAAVNYEGLQLSVRSIFNWYVHPMTADTLEEASLVFEDIEVPRVQIEAMGRAKKWLNIDAALNAPPVAEVEQARLELQGRAFGVNETDMQGKLGRSLTLTECWTFLKLPKSAYVSGEDCDCPVPVMVMLAGSTPVCVIRNPFYHQRPPYLFGRSNAAPGMIYGYDVGRLSRSLQYLTNDFTNQTNDCGNYALNPIGMRNPSLVAGPMRPLAPGVVWDFTDIEKGFKWERPPLELIGAGMSMAQMFMGWTQELGGAPPQLSGIAAGGSKTATGMQILQRNALSPLQDEVEDIEQDILIPLMYGTWYNGMQFRDRAVLGQLAGQTFNIDPAALSIDAEFRWLASSQAINSAQRSQQAMQLLQAIMPLMPLLQQNGYIVDPAPILQKVFTDGMGFRGFQSFIFKAQAAPGMPPPPGSPQPPGVAQEQQDRVRSALEQAAGGGTGDMVPGEGEDFQGVRAEGDQYAADMGRNYGG